MKEKKNLFLKKLNTTNYNKISIEKQNQISDLDKNLFFKEKIIFKFIYLLYFFIRTLNTINKSKLYSNFFHLSNMNKEYFGLLNSGSEFSIEKNKIDGTEPISLLIDKKTRYKILYKNILYSQIWNFSEKLRALWFWTDTKKYREFQVTRLYSLKFKYWYKKKLVSVALLKMKSYNNWDWLNNKILSWTLNNNIRYSKRRWNFFLKAYKKKFFLAYTREKPPLVTIQNKKLELKELKKKNKLHMVSTENFNKLTKKDHYRLERRLINKEFYNPTNRKILEETYNNIFIYFYKFNINKLYLSNIWTINSSSSKKNVKGIKFKSPEEIVISKISNKIYRYLDSPQSNYLVSTYSYNFINILNRLYKKNLTKYTQSLESINKNMAINTITKSIFSKFVQNSKVNPNFINSESCLLKSPKFNFSKEKLKKYDKILKNNSKISNKNKYLTNKNLLWKSFQYNLLEQEKVNVNIKSFNICLLLKYNKNLLNRFNEKIAYVSKKSGKNHKLINYQSKKYISRLYLNKKFKIILLDFIILKNSIKFLKKYLKKKKTKTNRKYLLEWKEVKAHKKRVENNNKSKKLQKRLNKSNSIKLKYIRKIKIKDLTKINYILKKKKNKIGSKLYFSRFSKALEQLIGDNSLLENLIKNKRKIVNERYEKRRRRIYKQSSNLSFIKPIDYIFKFYLNLNKGYQKRHELYKKYLIHIKNLKFDSIKFRLSYIKEQKFSNLIWNWKKSYILNKFKQNTKLKKAPKKDYYVYIKSSIYKLWLLQWKKRIYRVHFNNVDILRYHYKNQNSINYILNYFKYMQNTPKTKNFFIKGKAVNKLLILKEFKMRNYWYINNFFEIIIENKKEKFVDQNWCLYKDFYIDPYENNRIHYGLKSKFNLSNKVKLLNSIKERSSFIRLLRNLIIKFFFNLIELKDKLFQKELLFKRNQLDEIFINLENNKSIIEHISLLFNNLNSININKTKYELNKYLGSNIYMDNLPHNLIFFSFYKNIQK